MPRHEHTRDLHTRIQEGILSISLSSRLSRTIGQSPYQSRVLAMTSRCVYRPSVVQLFIWVFVYICLVAFYLSLHCNRVSLRAHPLPFHSIYLFKVFLLWISYFLIFFPAVFVFQCCSR